MNFLQNQLNLYCEQGKWRELTLFYHQIRQKGFRPNSFTFSTLLKALSSSSSSLPLPLHQGQAIHADTTKRGFIQSDNYVNNSVISIYSRRDSFHDARKLFDEIPHPISVHWNTIISSLFRAGDCDTAAELFGQMKHPNDITWSAMIAGYTQNDRPYNALYTFKQMRGIESNDLELSPAYSHTITSVFAACVQLGELRFGEQVHGYIMKISTYVETDAYVGSVLVDLYATCFCQELAKLVFDSMESKCVVAWTSLIAGYVWNDYPSCAIDAFKEMIYSGEEPNHVTLSTLITACANIPDLVLGKELHGFIVRRTRILKRDAFLWTSLIDMYGKCHYMEYAHRILEQDKFSLGCKTTPIWNATISGYVENDCLDDAWRVFRSMVQDSGSKPNSVTMAIVLPLCTRNCLLLYGKEIHCNALKSGLDEGMLVQNSLLDMYSKSGKLHLAENQFKRMIKKNRISWTSMIDGYGVHGDGKGAIAVFERMVRESDEKPDHVTFVALVSACSHSGLVDEGLRYFETMGKEYDIIPTEENYGSVVDLLARAGHLDEAKKLIEKMPIKPGVNVWGALLGGCRIHGNVKEAEYAAQYLLKLEPREGGFRKLLSGIYSDIGRLDCMAEVRSTMGEINVKKRSGLSWLETNQGFH